MKVNATSRSVQGTGASRRLRRAGRVPAVIYGGNDPAANIELDHNEIYHSLRREAFHASILDMNLEGKTEKVLLRAVQWHPYKQQVLHVDFQRVLAKQAITTKVPLTFINGEESPAVKVSKAMISHVTTELEITCLPGDLPASIEIDLGALEAGQTVHLEDIELPKGVTFVGLGEAANPALATALVKGGGAAAADGEEVEGDEAPEAGNDEPAAE